MEQNRSGKRPRIERADFQKMNREEKTANPDWAVWDILRPQIISMNRREMSEEIASGYARQSDRIKDITDRTRNLDIVDAFKTIYNIDEIKTDIRKIANTIPSNLTVGADIDLSIKDVSKKHGVIFDSGSYKTSFITRNNLSTINELPDTPVKARIIEIRPDYTIVDLIEPMMEKFIMPRTKAPWSQNVIENPEPIIVRNLKLVKGGFTGKAVIPNVSEFLGRPYEIDAFIPGSQIVLNTTEDFEQFEGQSVEAFIISYVNKPGSYGKSLICSRKNYIKCLGYKKLKKIHNMWCDDDQEWNNFSHTPLSGIVTGIINSSKNCGIFVEIPELCLTGLVAVKSDELTSYIAGQEVTVFFSDLEEELQYNDLMDQKQHIPAFEIENGAVKKCNIKPVLSFEV